MSVHTSFQRSMSNKEFTIGNIENQYKKLCNLLSKIHYPHQFTRER